MAFKLTDAAQERWRAVNAPPSREKSCLRYPIGHEAKAVPLVRRTDCEKDRIFTGGCYLRQALPLLLVDR
jgi:hypothetical protein